MKTYSYVLFWLNEELDLQEASFDKYADALNAYDSVEHCVLQKFYGDDFVCNMSQK